MGRFHFHDSAQKIGCRLSGLTCPDKHFSGHLCPDKLRTFGFGVVRENLRENVRENVRENLRENLRGLHAIFGLFSGIFRSKISGNFVKQEGHSFERAAVTANVRK